LDHLCKQTFTGSAHNESPHTAAAAVVSFCLVGSDLILLAGTENLHAHGYASGRSYILGHSSSQHAKVYKKYTVLFCCCLAWLTVANIILNQHASGVDDLLTRVLLPQQQVVSLLE
jgi:hypothetical protein